MTGLTLVAALVLMGLEVLRGAPQPYKLARKQIADGVSPSSTAVIAVLAAVWLFYAVISQAWASMASGVVALFFCTATAVLVARFTSARHVLVPAAGTAVALIAFITLGVALSIRDELTGVIIVGGTFAYGVPRLFTGLRADSLRGVSMLYLGLNVADALAFGVYGSVIGLWAYIGYAVVQTASCVPVMVRWWRYPDLR